MDSPPRLETWSSPAELWARVVELLEGMYRSAASGRMESIDPA